MIATAALFVTQAIVAARDDVSEPAVSTLVLALTLVLDAWAFLCLSGWFA